MTENQEVDDQVVDIEPYEGEPEEGNTKSMTDENGVQDDEAEVEDA